MVVLCCIAVVTGFLPSPVSRSSFSSPPSQVLFPNGHLIFQHLYSHCGAKDWLSGRAVSKARLDLLTLNFQ